MSFASPFCKYYALQRLHACPKLPWSGNPLPFFFAAISCYMWEDLFYRYIYIFIIEHEQEDEKLNNLCFKLNNGMHEIIYVKNEKRFVCQYFTSITGFMIIFVGKSILFVVIAPNIL